MALTIRKFFGKTIFFLLLQQFLSLYYRQNFSTNGAPAIGNGLLAGRLRTTASATGRVAGVEVTKASTDNLWDLSGETDTIAAQYRAYWLYINAAGTASIVAGPNASSAALALAALPAIAVDKSVFGVYVAGPATDFDAVGGLAAQGTIHDGIPEGANLPGGVFTYSAPQIITLVAA